MYNHIKSLNLPNDDKENDSKWKNGNRFDQDLYSLYILISMAGEYYSEILHRNFGFPSTRQIRSMKQKFKLKYGITDEILDGYESICKLNQLFWKSDDRRCVIAVDAASVNAKISIDSNGHVDGLLEELTIDKKLVDLISENLDDFHKFYETHHKEIVKYFFCFLRLFSKRRKQILSNSY